MQQPRRGPDDIVADALLVSRAAVRQSVKNLLIVRALRDREDFDADWFAAAVRHEFEQLAVEKETDAARLATVIAATRKKRGTPRHALDYRADDRKHLSLRRDVSLRLATALRDLALDETASQEIVAEARRQALDEISSAAAMAIRPPRDEPLSDIERMLALAALAEDVDNLRVRRRPQG